MFSKFKMLGIIESKEWTKLTNCIISEITDEGCKVEINIASDKTGILYLGTSRTNMINEFVGIFGVNKYTFDITGLEINKRYYFNIQNKSENESARSGVYSFKTTIYAPPIIIDIGSAAVVGDDYWTFAPRTFISQINPANATGKIISVQIYAQTSYSLENCEVATFYRPDPTNFPNKFTTRDYETVDNGHGAGVVIGGSTQTFIVDLDVVEGDYIGIYASWGRLRSTVNGTKFWYVNADNIPCTNETFLNEIIGDLSVYGTGSG